MRFRDILSVVTNHKDEHVIGVAEQLAQQNDARVSTLVVSWMPSLPLAVEGWSFEPMWAELISSSQKQLENEVAAVKARLERDQDVDTPESLLVNLVEARRAIGSRARRADLTVLGRPTKANSETAHALVEGALFNSGRPVLVAPPEWKRRKIGARVLVCWKPTREAARALADADDFLANAQGVTVVTVDARPSEDGYGPTPGADICAHLARRGISVELMNLPSAGRDETRTVLDQALAFDADLIVMGGYGHSRMSEFIFGGLTRGMLKASHVPLFLAH